MMDKEWPYVWTRFQLVGPLKRNPLSRSKYYKVRAWDFVELWVEIPQYLTLVQSLLKSWTASIWRSGNWEVKNLPKRFCRKEVVGIGPAGDSVSQGVGNIFVHLNDFRRAHCFHFFLEFFNICSTCQFHSEIERGFLTSGIFQVFNF